MSVCGVAVTVLSGCLVQRVQLEECVLHCTVMYCNVMYCACSPTRACICHCALPCGVQIEQLEERVRAAESAAAAAASSGAAAPASAAATAAAEEQLVQLQQQLAASRTQVGRRCGAMGQRVVCYAL